MNETMNFLKLAAYGVFAYLDIPADVFNILITFICLDTIFGLTASFRLDKKIKFNLLMWGIYLKVAMLLLPLIVALLAKGLEMDFRIVVGLSIKLLIVSEFFSITGHFYSIRTKKELGKIDVVSMLLLSFRTAAKNYIQKGLLRIERAGNCEKK